MKKIKINFCDFWPGFDPQNNYFYNLLKEEFEIEISSTPQYLFYSVFGVQHLRYTNCIKVWYTGENIGPNFNECNYSFSFDNLEDERNYRLPHYLLYDGYYDLTNKNITNPELLLNRKFCNFVVSNGGCEKRNKFFEKLSKYKKVDSGGRYCNNIGYAVTDKRKFQSEYKFSIAFENNAYRPEYETYVTEKIMDPMVVNSIPLYWGASKINEDFNTKSFINYYDFESEDRMIDYIVYLDTHNDLYLKMLNEPWFVDNKIPDNNKLENIKKFLYNICQK